MSAAGDPLPVRNETIPRANRARLLEAHPTDGPDYQVGQDPRRANKDDLASCGHARSVLEAIRAKCLDCCCQQPSEVRYCTAVLCTLWPFRMGTNPLRKPLSEEQRAERGARLRQARAAREQPNFNGPEPEKPSPVGNTGGEDGRDFLDDEAAP